MEIIIIPYPFLISRSLFVPYFKYLLSSCVHHLGDGGYLKLFSSSQKKKKAKILGDGDVKETDVLSIKGWHLRTLVLSSLHKCFLYDTGSPKFLDSSNFQASIFFHCTIYFKNMELSLKSCQYLFHVV